METDPDAPRDEVELTMTLLDNQMSNGLMHHFDYQKIYRKRLQMVSINKLRW